MYYSISYYLKKNIQSLLNYFEKLNISELILSKFSVSLLIEAFGINLENLSPALLFLRIENLIEDKNDTFEIPNKRLSLVSLDF